MEVMTRRREMHRKRPNFIDNDLVKSGCRRGMPNEITTFLYTDVFGVIVWNVNVFSMYAPVFFRFFN